MFASLYLLYLCYHGRCSRRLVLPVSRELSGGTVVSSKTVDTRLNKNQTELGVLVLAVAFKMLTNLYSLLDKHVKILWNLWSKSVSLEDTYDLLSSYRLNLSDTVGITKDNSDLGWGKTLLSELAYVLLNISSRNLQPRWWRALVW